MKLWISLILLILLCLTLTACSSKKVDASEENQQTTAAANKATGRLTPYKINARETRLLDAFGVGNRIALYDMRVPEGAISMHISGYVMRDGGDWESLGSSAMMKDQEDNDTAFDVGDSFSLQINEDGTISFHGPMSAKIFNIVPDQKWLGLSTCFLEESVSIELNKEIPVLLCEYDYDGSGLRSVALEQFFEPGQLRDADFVQAVTITFYDHPVENEQEVPTE